jgi:anti-anti-sigma factor
LHAISETGVSALTEEPVAEDDNFDIAADDDERGTIVRLHGRIGLDSSPILRDRLLAILQGQPLKGITVDLTGVTSIDASGVATLLEALRIARKRHTTLCLKGLQGRAARLFEVTGLQGVFETGCKDAWPELR